MQRENFFKILDDTLRDNSFSLTFKRKELPIEFSSYDKLNIIFHDDYSQEALDKLTAEYKRSNNRIKEVFQKLYVFTAFKTFLKTFFVNKSIQLDSSLRDFAIVGGNHRVRLFAENLESICVLLKTGENRKFLVNDVKLRIDNSVSYAPKVLEYGNDWLIETFVSGTPLNRLGKEAQEDATRSIIHKHLDELLLPTKKEINLSEYFSLIYEEINALLEIAAREGQPILGISKWLKDIGNQLIALGTSSVEVCESHGDFQQGNIRVSDSGEIYVLDWEASDTRFYLYDLYVILGEVRTGVPFEISFERFVNNIGYYEDSFSKYSKSFLKMVLCVEELRFNLNEDVSANYFSQGAKARRFLKSISQNED